MDRNEADRVYDASLETFRKASAEFRKIAARYRAREIGDEEFLAARKAFKNAEETADAAERAYIDSCNSV